MVRRALEHHVFEQMGETGTARLLVLAAHVVPHVHRRHRNVVILVEDDLQPVVQVVFLELEFGGVLGGGNSSGKQDQDQYRDVEFRGRHQVLLE